MLMRLNCCCCFFFFFNILAILGCNVHINSVFQEQVDQKILLPAPFKQANSLFFCFFFANMTLVAASHPIFGKQGAVH